MKEHLEQIVRGRDPLQGRNLAREYLQARILGALQRAGAMTALAFQGGTCLRFLFSLPRYSEDLDFAQEREPADYSLRRCLRAVRAELSAERYDVDLRVRDQGRAVHGVSSGDASGTESAVGTTCPPDDCASTWPLSFQEIPTIDIVADGAARQEVGVQFPRRAPAETAWRSCHLTRR